MARKAKVFISYSHQDAAWCEAVARQLRALHDPLEADIWVDSRLIRAGSEWLPEIEEGLASADLAVLLVSDSFLSSDFIRGIELPKLLERRKAGLPVIPLLVDSCPWKQIGWLHETELRPRGGEPLALTGKVTSPRVKRLISEAVEEIAQLLQEPAAPPSSDPTDAVERAASLVAQVLLQELDEEARLLLGRRLVQRIAEFSGMTGEALSRAVRMFVEYHLLRSDDPTSPQLLLGSLELLPTHDTARRLLAELKRGARTGDYGQGVIEVNSLFFMHACERETLWEAYFEALSRAGAVAGEVATLCRIRVKHGFVAPQFLVAGLLSRFHDDWRPVLNAYQHAVPSPKIRDGSFESLQASQWNCWLVWGPSIPLCRCAQWQGKFAFQYGYGDENNSLPLLELESDENGRPLALDPLAASLARDGRGARLVQLTGRLRWGPYFLQPQIPPDETPADDDVIDDEVVDEEPADAPPNPPDKYGMAVAQAGVYAGDGPTHAHHSDGLILQLEAIDDAPAESRVYFSAYLWLIFLVAGPGGADAGPQLLRRKDYPPWPRRPADRARVRDARLWEDLLPVFVHANVADPAALRFQRRMLVSNALALLRQVWDGRAEYFDGDDVSAGIRFHLVCGSDYSGCGEPVRYPSSDPLTALLRKRLAAEADREFADAVVVPGPEEPPQERPWGLAGYFSACHLPELVADYFQHVAEVRAKGRR